MIDNLTSYQKFSSSNGNLAVDERNNNFTVKLHA